MRVRAIVPFTTERGEIPVGSILTIPEELLAKLTGKIATCQARKVGGRICGAPLKEGINGHWSCSDKHCQVPATSHRGGLK